MRTIAHYKDWGFEGVFTMLSIISNPICWGGLLAFIVGQLAIDAVSAMQEQRQRDAQDEVEHKEHRFA